jgi:hypothetical protein
VPSWGLFVAILSTVKITMVHRQVFKGCEIATRNKVANLAVENGPDIMRRIANFASTIK